MKRYIQFEEGDNPGALTQYELTALLTTLGRRLIGVTFEKVMANSASFLSEVTRTELADELLTLNESTNGGAILLSDGTEVRSASDAPTFASDTETVTASNVGEAIAFAFSSLMRGMESPTVEETLENPQQQPLDNAEYKWYASRSEPGLWHEVTLVGGIPTACTCKGFEYRGNCRHIREALRG